MQINFTVFATGVLLAGNKLRYKAYQADSPTAEVASLTEDPPHTFPHAVTINVPNPVVHILKIFSTPDASTGTLISEFLYDPTYTNVEIRLPLQLIGGGAGEFDPEADSKELTIPFLTEWENLWYPERRANGGTMADFEYTRKVDGGLTLMGDDTFADSELIFIHFEPKITLSAPTFNYINLFNGFAIITEDKTLDADYYRKLISIAALATSITVTLQALSDVPELTIFAFTTMMGNQKQCTIKTNSGADFFKLSNGNATEIYLGSNEKLWLLKTATGWQVIDISDGVSRVGAQIDSDTILPNTAWMDGSTLLGADYPRVRAYVLNLPGGYTATAAQKISGNVLYAGLWCYDADTDLIYLPDYRGNYKRSLPGTRGNDTTRDNTAITGSYRAGGLQEHKHFTTVPGQFNTGGFPNNINRNPAVNRSLFEAWSKTSGTGKESAWLAGAIDDTYIPSIAPTSGLIGGAGTTENLVSCVGVKTLVYL